MGNIEESNHDFNRGFRYIKRQFREASGIDRALLVAFALAALGILWALVITTW